MTKNRNEELPPRTILIIVLFFTCFGLIGILTFNKDEFGHREVHGVVTSIGACGGGEGLFSGPYECKVTVNVNGDTQYWLVLGKVVLGETISRTCHSREISTGKVEPFCAAPSI